MHIRNRNIRLRTAIYESGLTQRAIATKTGIHESIMSMIVNGKYVPDVQQKRKIALVLRKDETELF